MAVTVTIAGTNRTSAVYRPEGGPPSIRLTMQLGSDWTCEFPVYDTDSTSSAFRPSLGQGVVIADGATTIFKGNIKRIEDKPITGTGSGTLTMVTARAYAGFVDQIVVTETYAAGQTLHDVVSDLATTYLTGYGVSLDAGMATGDTLEAQSFEDVTMRDALNHLSTITGWLWRITPSDVLEFFAAGDKTASYSLTAANKLSVGPVTWEQTREKYVNDVHLRYGTETTATKTQTITGDGVLDEWALDYDSARNVDDYILSAGYVTDNGVFSPLSPFGGSTDWQFGSGTNHLYKTSGALGNGLIATFTYTAQFPQTVNVQDAAGIAANGTYSAVFEAPDIFDKDAATELATGLLRRYLTVPKWVRLSTRQSFVMPGDQITLTFADRIISGAHIITEVRGADIAMDGTFQYDLTCLSGGEKQETWTDQLRDVLGSVGGARAAGGTISGSAVPNFSGHFDGDVSAHTGGDTDPDDYEAALTTFTNSAGTGPALRLGRPDQDWRWGIIADADHGATPGTVGKLRFHVLRRGSSVSSAMELAEPDTGGTDDFIILPGSNANLYIGDYAALMSGLSPSDSRIEGILCANIRATSGIFEASRTTAIGKWITVAFSAGNFTANGSMTWTVASGDQSLYRYTLSGSTMTLAFSILTSTVGGTPNTDLRIAIPGGFTATQTGVCGALYVNDNGTIGPAGLMSTTATAGYVILRKSQETNWSASTDNTAVAGTAIFEVT
jgi:hypothetical protein